MFNAPGWLNDLNTELDSIEIPEFYLPPYDSLRECFRILSHREANNIFNAAMFAHSGSEAAAERSREAAGYGGLGIE